MTTARFYDCVSFRICVLALRLCGDMERLRLDTIRIGLFVTRAHMHSLRNNNRGTWSLRDDGSYVVVHEFAFRLEPSLSEDGIRLSISHASNTAHQMKCQSSRENAS